MIDNRVIYTVQLANGMSAEFSYSIIRPYALTIRGAQRIMNRDKAFEPATVLRVEPCTIK